LEFACLYTMGFLTLFTLSVLFSATAQDSTEILLDKANRYHYETNSWVERQKENVQSENLRSPALPTAEDETYSAGPQSFGVEMPLEQEEKQDSEFAYGPDEEIYSRIQENHRNEQINELRNKVLADSTESIQKQYNEFVKEVKKKFSDNPGLAHYWIQMAREDSYKNLQNVVNSFMSY
jgi:hypothetical protein